MDQLVEVAYRRHRLELVHFETIDLETGQIHREARAVILDVHVENRYRCPLRGVVSHTDVLRWNQADLPEEEFVATVARMAAECLVAEVVMNPEVVALGASLTFPCPAPYPAFDSPLMPPVAGALVLSFTM